MKATSRLRRYDAEARRRLAWTVTGWEEAASGATMSVAEARRRFGRSIATGEEGPAAIRWNRGSVRPFPCAVGAAEAAGLAHRAQEQQLVDLLERPARVAGREPTDPGGQVGRLSRCQALHQQEPVDGPGRRGGRAALPAPCAWDWSGWVRLQVRPWRPPRPGATTSRGEMIARDPVTRAVPGRPCPTCPSVALRPDGGSGAVGAYWAAPYLAAMTLPSVRTWYLRTPYRTAPRTACHRLSAMRVRAFELRLIAVALVVCWSVAAALVLLAYRPGGPLDLVVGLLALTPIAIALAGADLAAGRARRCRLPGDRLARDPRPALPGPVDHGRRQPAAGVRVAHAAAVGRGGLSVAPRAVRHEPVQRLRDRATAPGRDGHPAPTPDRRDDHRRGPDVARPGSPSGRSPWPTTSPCATDRSRRRASARPPAPTSRHRAMRT